jgi:hypothetical protein
MATSPGDAGIRTEENRQAGTQESTANSVPGQDDEASVDSGRGLGEQADSQYENAFVRLLNNRAKGGKDAREGPARTRGFVVLVRKANTLQPLQGLCLRQPWNRCLTARYRLRSGPVFGTLLTSLVLDLARWRNSQPPLTGDLVPTPFDRDPTAASASRDWDRPVAKLLESLQESGQWELKESHGELNQNALNLLLDALADQRILDPGRRLVLFVEVAQPSRSTDEGDEWDEALKVLLSRLPERVGVVITGAPPRFRLPPDDPHYLEVDQLPAGPSAQEVYAYRLSALRGDQPAAQDLLGYIPFADGLARLILHPGTDPLTVGIHGPWGRGKSSFMRFLADALIRRAPGNRVASAWLPRVNLQAFGRRISVEPTPLWRNILVEPIPLAERLAQRDKDIAQLDHNPETPPGSPANRRERGRALRKRDRLWRRMRREAARHLVVVDFNAWRYQDATQIWAGLASEITRRLEQSLPWGVRMRTPLAYAWRNRRTQLFVDLVLPAILAALVATMLAVAGIDRLQAWVNDQLTARLPTLGPFPRVLLPAGVAFVLAVWFLTVRVRRVLQPVSQRVLEYVRLPDYRDRMGYQHQVLDDLAFIHGRLQPHRFLRLRRWARDRLGRLTRRPPTGPQDPRVVVFIDDLDRCSDDKVMDLLQAINLVLGASDFFVILGMDTDMIHRAIRRHYGNDDAGPDRLPERFAETYLHKIIQLSFNLPEATKNDDFIAELFSPAARPGGQDGQTQPPTAVDRSARTRGSFPFDSGLLQEPVVQVLKEIEDSPEELKAFLELREFVGYNPRELKRIVNVHRLVKILLQRPDTSQTEDHQRKLVSWLVFCTLWPDLIKGVLDHARADVNSAGANQAEPNGPSPIRRAVKDLHLTQEGRPRLQGFAVGPQAAALTAEDLRPDGPLAVAAEISQLIRHEELTEEELTEPTSHSFVDSERLM